MLNSQDYKHSQTTEACAAYAKCLLCSDTLSWTHKETVVDEMCELRLDAVSHSLCVPLVVSVSISVCVLVNMESREQNAVTQTPAMKTILL